MKHVRAGQASGALERVPAYGALVGVDELVLARPRKLLLHLLDDAQVVGVASHAALEVEEEPLELHADDQAGHGQIEVAVDEHVQVVEEVDGDHARLEREVDVVDDGALVGRLRHIVDVAQVHRVARDHVERAQCETQRLEVVVVLFSFFDLIWHLHILPITSANMKRTTLRLLAGVSPPPPPPPPFSTRPRISERTVSVTHAS